jgi:hypothetical protein
MRAPPAHCAAAPHLPLFCCRHDAACGLEEDMSAVYRMLSQLANYDAGATVTAPEYE